MPSFSLRNPHTIIVGALIATLLGVTAFAKMPVDVFPKLHIPAVVVATFYPGMPPLEMERDITTRFERFFTLGSGIDHIESRSLPGVSIIKVFFHPGVNVQAAAAALGDLAMADLRHMPPGTLPPLILKAGASSLPVVLVTVSGKGIRQTQLRDQADYNIRNFLATVPGASVPPSFGGRYRQIEAYVNREALEARGLSLMDVVRSLNQTNLIIPAGDAVIGNTDYFIYTNSMVKKAGDIDKIPIKVGAGEVPVFFGDVGQAKDAYRIPHDMVRIDGRHAVYIPVLKQGGANTIAVVNGIERLLPKIPGLPKGIKLKAIFSQSTYILNAVHALENEAVSGSILASVMILLFLGSFRSTFAIFLSIPLSILAAGFALWLGGSTTNLMTLGGFALAIGRLVDNSVVVLENIERHLDAGESPEVAARTGADEVDLPVLASTLTTIIVFFPVVFLFGVAKYLFSALALAVTLAMVASYVVAMTLIPIYCARFLTREEAAETEEGKGKGPLAAFIRAYDRFADRFAGWLGRALDRKLAVIGAIALLFIASMVIFPQLGTQFFPRTDSGQFIVQFHAPVGSSIEATDRLAAQLEKLIRHVIPPGELSATVGQLGLSPGFSAIYSPNAATDSGVEMVALKPGHQVSTWHYMNELQRLLPEKLPQIEAFFSSGSIIDSVLNLGLAAPIDVQLSGQSYRPLFSAAEKIEDRLRGLPEVKQTFIPERSGEPTLMIHVNRVAAARLGLTQRDVVSNVITALTSNVMIAPSIWIDPKSGNDYFLAVQYPQKEINSFQTLENIPVGTVRAAYGAPRTLLLRNVATITPERNPAEADHYNIQRVVDVLVSPSTDDLGGTQTAIARALKGIKLPPHVKIVYRGSVAAMQKAFSSFGFGLAMAVALLYLVMVAQFRSFLDPVIIMFAVPMGLIGVVWTLYLTGTTLNIESFMGIVAMVGIVVSNAILLVDFANRRRRGGQELRAAIIESAKIRMRPILMTALATVFGLLTIALKLGAGSEASAPLARAALGGLVVSTVFTLVLVPAVYELFYSRKEVSR
ncbi:MAG: efflux RND transporter permease subunit [Candidatus Binataceae bacterium]